MSTDIDDDTNISSETPDDKPKEMFPGYQTMEELKKEGYKMMMEGIRHSNALPNGHDWNFYNAFESFSKIMSDESQNVMRLMNTIMRCNEMDSNIKNRILDEKTELVIEANDIILERVANNIDEMNGIKKTVPEPVIIQTVSAQLPINGSWNRAKSIMSVNTIAAEAQSKDISNTKCINLITAKNIIRPQKFFKDKIDNTLHSPWQPRIKDKPNSIKPLAIFLEEYENRQEFSHPYDCELEKFTPLPEFLKSEDLPLPPKSVTNTPLIEIDQPEQLDELIETLRKYKEIAIDLEHHSYRSFMGITCLMQISTPDQDFLIDTLVLRDKLHLLNDIFTKPTILKIFHGADSDIEWLQRDLSLYIVNMFDTHQAAKILEYSGLSLAFLMKKFCNHVSDKRFQLADWRMRPLPDELKQYAREDTHFLIYIYKMLKRELLAKLHGDEKLLAVVFQRSTELCKKRYFKPILTDDSHMELYRRSKKLFDNRQLYGLKELYAWRDHIAREQDESVAYVLPNHMLLQIAETLPREMQGILACCSPIPPLVRSHLLEIHHIILKARDQPIEKPVLKEDNRAPGVIKQVSKLNIDNPLHCPHDLTPNTEIQDNLPTLLNHRNFNNEILNLQFDIERKESMYSVFNSGEDLYEKKVAKERFKKVRGLSYLSPYQRYILVKPFVQSEESMNEENVEEVAEKSSDDKIKEMLGQEGDNRTDADRIASVREHFMKISKQFKEDNAVKQRLLKEEEERQRQLTLLQLSGSRKRKREDSDDGLPVGESCIPGKNFHTPTPFMPAVEGRVRRNRKRKHEPNDQHQQQQQRQQQQKQQQQKQQQQPNPEKKKKKKNKKKLKPNQNQNELEKGETMQPYQSTSNTQQPQQQKQNNRNNFVRNREQRFPGNNNKRWRGGNNKADNSQTNFVPYDYTSVDFRQFQGGAERVDTGVNVRPNFKNKNRKKMGKRGGKSATFFGNKN